MLAVMRYSMKWILAAMVYVAIAAAAFSQESWVYADLLWLVTFVAFGYAFLRGCTGIGAQRWRATGFVFLSLCYVVCLHFSPESVPTGRLLVSVFESPIAPPPAVYSAPVVSSPQVIYQSAPGGMVAIRQPQIPPGTGWRPNPARTVGVADYHTAFMARAANAIATMFSGLVGCLLGSLAYNRARRDAVQ